MRTSRLLALLATLAAAGCGDPGAVRAASEAGFADDRTTLQVVSTNVGGKNVYIPATLVVTAGKGQTLSLFNTTDMPHGFAIAGLGIQEILPPGAEHAVALPDLEGGNVYHVHCHLHPPHRTGTLVVLHGR